ncbi:MAG: SMI1/KNR4 family protein [Sandaracinus sp.]|nr:SMI1/KNR4 family protein [Sandaracinus sp.]
MAALERKHDVTLPYSYRRYLALMGHDADGLFAHDHVQVTYHEVMQLRDEVTELDDDGRPGLELPPRALVISGRLGEDYLYVVCDGEDDVEVVYASAATDVPSRRSHASILEWLEVWLAEAEVVLRDGR